MTGVQPMVILRAGWGKKFTLFRPMIDSSLQTSIEVATVQQIRNRAGMLLGNEEILLQFY